MTIIQAVNDVDNLKPNMYELPDKIKWLSRLDKRIFEEVLLTHELSKEEKQPFLPENTETPAPPEEELGFWALELPSPPPPPPEEKLVFPGYTEGDQDKELIVGEPFDELYIHWLCAQIDRNNMEYIGFNNANALFEATYGAFRNAFNRSHEPKSRPKRYY